MKDDGMRRPKTKPAENDEEFDFRDYQLERDREEAEEAKRQQLLDEEEDAKMQAEIWDDPGELTEEELADIGIPQGEENAQTQGKQEQAKD